MPAGIDAPDVVAADVQPDTAVQELPTLPDVAPPADVPDAADDVPDAALPDAVPDVLPDVAPDVAPDAAPDLGPVDVGEDATVGCATNADCAALDDANLCNGTMACVAGACQIDPKTVVTCPAATGGTCFGPVCETATGKCVDTTLANGTPCDDGNPCTIQEVCTAGACFGQSNPCDDLNACTQDSCNPATGNCIHLPKTSVGCDDGDKCTTADACDAGGNCVGTAVTCGAPKGACWSKTCEAASGQCVDNALSGTGCDDGDKCTTQDTCAAGTCAGTPVVCASANPCVASACDGASGQCGSMNKPGGTPCQSDTDACTTQVCAAGSCVVSGTTTACAPDGDPCTDDTCHATTGCYAKTPDGGSCDDGNNCTSITVCNAGKCTGPIDLNVCPEAALVACPPKYIIQMQSQLLTGKLNLAVAAPMQPGGPTRVSHGLKMPTNTAIPTQNVQLELAVTMTPPPSTPPVLTVTVGAVNGTACGGGIYPATLLPATSGGTYEWNTEAGKTYWIALELDPTIYPKDAVFDAYYTVKTADINGFCDPPSNCAKIACDGKPCSDGNLCTLDDVCAAGACKPGPEKICPPDTNTCTTDVCSLVTGNCGIPLPDGSVCDDGNPCTEKDACKGILCKGDAKVCVDDNNACTLDFCDAGSGQCNYAAPDGSFCSDGNACTSGDTCLAGACKAGVATTCQNDNNPCTNDFCDPVSGSCGKAVADGTACEDGNACTTGDSCAFGYCQAGPAVVCKNDFNACTVDTCDYKTGACNLPILDGTWCDDGNACTDGDKCKTGKCLGGKALVCDDANTCTADLCVPSLGCQNLASISQLTPIIDGTIGSDWVGVMPATTNGQQTDWGVGKNELHAVYLAQDATWLYVAVDGYVEPANAIVGYVDTDYGQGTGVNDFKLLTDQTGLLDNALSNTMTIDSSDFGAEVAFGTVGMQSCALQADGAGWRRLKPVDNLPWIDGQLQATATGFEARIALASLYPGGMPASGASLAVVLRIVNADGSVLSNQVLPSQWFNDGTTGVPNPQPFAVLSVGNCDDGNACTSGDVCSFGNCQGQPFTCADTGNPCTVAQCTPSSGCAPVPMTDGTPCNNASGCTALDKCLSGSCAEGKCP